MAALLDDGVAQGFMHHLDTVGELAHGVASSIVVVECEHHRSNLVSEVTHRSHPLSTCSLTLHFLKCRPRPCAVVKDRPQSH
jgi:hypothetical protein